MVRTRFAPSPTGYLHIGGVRTALFNWLFARQHGGQFILRIDDTDQQRNIADTLPPILEGFKWLGIEWDEGPEVGGPHAPYFQSERGERYRQAVEELLARGAAYRDYARPEELQAEREEAERQGQAFVYSRRWMAETPDQAARFEAEGRQAVVRLKMPREGVCQFHDLVRGPLEFEWKNEQDHVIQRADGTCLYHLASVVDDAELEITHVIRAVEHLSNTPRQIFIAQSLGYKLPEYAHLPYVAEPGSQSKLSKRKIDKYLKNPDFQKVYAHGREIAERIGVPVTPESFSPVLVDFYRTVGYVPEAVVNYLLLLGWSLDDKTEEFTRDEMIRHFDLARINKSPASLDVTKLWSFQQRYMQRVPLDTKLDMALPYLQKAGWVSDSVPSDMKERVRRIVEAAGDRIVVAGDVLQYREFFVGDGEFDYDEKAFEKRLVQDAAAPGLLRRLAERLRGLEEVNAASLEAAIKQFVADEGVKLSVLVHPLRVAITGKAVGFGLFETMDILGRDACLARIERAVRRAEGGEGKSNDGQ